MISIHLDSPVLRRINDCQTNEKITLVINSFELMLNKYFLIAISPHIHSRYILNKNLYEVNISTFIESPDTYNIIKGILELEKTEFYLDNMILKDLFHIGMILDIKELKELYKTHVINKMTLDKNNCFTLLEYYNDLSSTEKMRECIDFISSHFFEFNEHQLKSKLKIFGYDILEQLIENEKLTIVDEDFLARTILFLAQEKEIFFPLIEHVHFEFCSEQVINKILDLSNTNNYIDVIKCLHNSLIRTKTSDDQFSRYSILSKSTEELNWDPQLSELENVYKYYCEILDRRNLYIMSYLKKEGLLEKKYKDSDSNEKTILQIASENGNLNLVIYLISIGADKETKDKTGSTPIIWASRNGHVDVVKYLDSVGADKEVKDKYGNTPLIWASRNGNVEVVEYLLSAGANKEEKDKYGYTPLMCASTNNKLSVVKCLVAAGANIEKKNKDGSTPLICASRNGHLEVAKYLVSVGANKEAKDNYGFTSLILASSNGHLEVVKYLCSIKADYEATSDNGYTPLISASSGGYLDVVSYLVSIGAIKEAKNCEGSTPLICAARNGKLEVVKYLVTIGANKDAKDQIGVTALGWAAAIDNLGIAQYLISAGADKNAKNNDGKTILSFARGSVADYLKSIGAK